MVARLENCRMATSSLPVLLEMRTTSESGRGLYARQRVEKGTKLLTSQPLAHVVKAELRTAICQTCLKKMEKLLRCGGCKFLCYCSKSCQREDWSWHKSECAGLKTVQERAGHSKVPVDTMRLVLRLVVMAMASTSRRLELESLISNDRNMSDKVKEDMAAIVMGVVMLLGRDGDRGLIFSTLGRVMSNTFNIMDSSYEKAIGLGVYGTPSLINHSCQPNSTVVFSGSTLILRCGLTLDPGDQVLISYCELVNSRERRQAQLQKVYSFLCACSRCHTEGSFPPSDVTYAAKRERVTEEEREMMMQKCFSLVDGGLKDLENNEDWPGFIENCSRVLGQSCDVLHPLNVAVTSVREQLMRGQLSLQQWQGALDNGEILTRAYRQYLPCCHPAYITHLIKAAKLRRILGSTPHLETSVEELQEAYRLIPLTFGGESPLLGEVVEMVEDSRAELSRRRT